MLKLRVNLQALLLHALKTLNAQPDEVAHWSGVDATIHSGLCPKSYVTQEMQHDVLSCLGYMPTAEQNGIVHMVLRNERQRMELGFLALQIGIEITLVTDLLFVPKRRNSRNRKP